MSDDRWMAAALALARRGLGRVWPNPAVGCVIVKDGRLIGRARTADGGRPHAETQALAQAGEAARGATAYVTLEPCAHHGQTPPCADALVAAGIARVVIAGRDPDPRVNGRGVSLLKAQGIEVTEGVLIDQARALQAGYLSRIERGRPWITLKLAMTLDGRIATASGESQWITGPAARGHVHARRAAHDAILVGAGTVRADNPRLTVRGMGAGAPSPVRVVLSTALDLPQDATLFTSAGDAQTWVLHTTGDPTAFEAAGARSLRVQGGSVGPDIGAAVERLGAEGLTRVYCEGGGGVAASLLGAGLVDRLEVYTAGAAIGAEGRAGVGEIGLARLADAPRLSLVTHQSFGPDLLTVWEATNDT